MCHFITMIVPTDDLAAVSAVMKRHGREARPIDNPSVRKVLRPGEHQYVTTSGHCDCGTVLSARGETAEPPEKQLADEEARLRRKGWSNAKIARAIEGRRKAEAKPKSAKLDSFDLWETVLGDLRAELKLPYVGLFIRFYSGAIDSEVFDASRRETPRGAPSRGFLAAMKEDEITIFH